MLSDACHKSSSNQHHPRVTEKHNKSQCASCTRSAHHETDKGPTTQRANTSGWSSTAQRAISTGSEHSSTNSACDHARTKTNNSTQGSTKPTDTRQSMQQITDFTCTVLRSHHTTPPPTHHPPTHTRHHHPTTTPPPTHPPTHPT